MNDLVLRVDEFIGEGLERGLRAHHRRRLTKLGWAAVFDAGPGEWASGDPPRRSGNSVEVLIDGVEAFAAMNEAIRGARSHVHIAGWHVTPDFVLTRAPPVALRDLLADAAGRVDVRVLLWAGAPLPPPLTPSRRRVRVASEELERTQVAVALDARSDCSIAITKRSSWSTMMSRSWEGSTLRVWGAIVSTARLTRSGAPSDGTMLHARGANEARPVYVVAKVAVVDDLWLIIGSANLNNHSLFNDSEVNVVVRDSNLARTTRHRLWAEHLERPREEVGGDPVALFENQWGPIAREQMERRAQGLPLTHRLVRLPHVSKRAKRLLGPLQTLVVDG